MKRGELSISPQSSNSHRSGPMDSEQLYANILLWDQIVSTVLIHRQELGEVSQREKRKERKKGKGQKEKRKKRTSATTFRGPLRLAKLFPLGATGGRDCRATSASQF
jgi:hypothetical protein